MTQTYLIKPPVKFLPFSHRYYKLDQEFFTTIRGKRYPRKYKLEVGMIIRPVIGSHKFPKAKILNIDFKPIKAYSLETLKQDAERPGRTISSHEDFIKEIDALWRFQTVMMNTETSIIYSQYLSR